MTTKTHEIRIRLDEETWQLAMRLKADAEDLAGVGIGAPTFLTSMLKRSIRAGAEGLPSLLRRELIEKRVSVAPETLALQERLRAMEHAGRRRPEDK